MTEVRFGIIGTGLIASRFACALNMTPGVCAAGISSRSEENGRRFAEVNHVEKVYVGAEALVNSPDIDVVYVATPHPTHFENCMQALRAGKAVLCEKPMTTRACDAEALFAEAKRQHVFLMEGMWSRFLPNSIHAKEWIDQGRIGKLRFIDGMFSFAVDPVAPKPRLVERRLGGGSLYDLGVYTVEMASYYAGNDPQEWNGFAADYTLGVDATAVMALRYPNDILATLRTGITCDAPVMMTLYGDAGRIELPRFFVTGKARLYDSNGQLVEELDTDEELPRGFCHEIAAVRDAYNCGLTESAMVPPSTTLATSALLEDMMTRLYGSVSEE